MGINKKPPHPVVDNFKKNEFYLKKILFYLFQAQVFSLSVAPAKVLLA